MRYLIDGYNLIHAYPALKSIASTNIESARDSLVEMAAILLKPDVQVVVVFDGQGTTTDTSPALPGVDGLLTVFTARNLSADTWIERAVYRAKKRHLCTVITADGGIRDLCRGLGARVLTPEWMDSEIGRTRTGPTESRRPGTQGISAQELGDRLNTDAHDRLAALRKKLGNEDSSEK